MNYRNRREHNQPINISVEIEDVQQKEIRSQSEMEIGKKKDSRKRWKLKISKDNSTYGQ